LHYFIAVPSQFAWTKPFTMTSKHSQAPSFARSVLAWPAWLRVLAVLPVLMLLWLAVLWASVEAVPL
jgi:hypothetical protein